MNMSTILILSVFVLLVLLKISVMYRIPTRKNPGCEYCKYFDIVHCDHPENKTTILKWKREYSYYKREPEKMNAFNRCGWFEAKEEQS